MNRRQFLGSGCAAGAALAMGPAWAGRAMFHSSGGVAIGGYDAVSYFSATGPRPGRRDIGLMWKGALWLFATRGHRDLFESNPWPLAPRFGAYCALAMAQGRLTPGNPMSWQLAGGRLYLTENQEARALWLADAATNIVKAEAQWPGILYGEGS
ncbi:MAG: YHS domain protein [Rhodobacteraceae bacterium]|nr:YHS domain protein [Paracoccaceae bacterium]